MQRFVTNVTQLSCNKHYQSKKSRLWRREKKMKEIVMINPNSISIVYFSITIGLNYTFTLFDLWKYNKYKKKILKIKSDVSNLGLQIQFTEPCQHHQCIWLHCAVNYIFMVVCVDDRTFEIYNYMSRKTSTWYNNSENMNNNNLIIN